MTPGIQKVVDHVARTEGWSITPVHGYLRREDGTCPLISWRRRYALTGREVQLVMNAADNIPGEANQSIRAAMLKAARLA